MVESVSKSSLYILYSDGPKDRKEFKVEVDGDEYDLLNNGTGKGNGLCYKTKTELLEHHNERNF